MVGGAYGKFDDFSTLTDDTTKEYINTVLGFIDLIIILL